MKWNSMLESEETLGVYNFTNADRYISFAQTAGVRIRGHVMIVGSFKDESYPVAVRTLVEASDDPNATLIEIMREHIHTVALHFGEKVGCWDVVNEHFLGRNDDNIFFRTLGDDYIKIAFELAREVLPNTPLVWNEVLTDFNLSGQGAKNWLALLRQYKDEGVPIDRIGLQGHVYKTLHDVDKLREFFDVVVGLGYGVEVTEYDAPIAAFVDQSDFLYNLVNINGPFQAQADYTASYLKACLDCGRCEGFTFWGLSDAFWWLDKLVFPDQPLSLPLLIDEEGYRKPVWLSVRKTLESFTAPQTFFDFLFDTLWSFLSSICNGLSNVWGFIWGP
jgi:endo-1,4-beta-xylanase